MFRLRKLYLFLAALVLITYAFRDTLYKTWTIATLGLGWRSHSSTFRLSETDDNFDVTFQNYTRDQLSSAPYPDLVPPILHHIALGRPDWESTWGVAVQSCLDIHPGWESHIWTTESATALVAEKFPHLQEMWDGYKYPIERVDALRYMILHEYGGVVLDMDLKCLQALGPLRRFHFVAPEARPTGFSIGFMMAEKGNAFVQSILDNLRGYDKQWFWLPYATVMFSTGCHFASVIHVLQPHRELLKILPGPLHSLSGHVRTPLFEHMGSSSWHSYDAQFLKTVDKKDLLLWVYYAGMIFVAVKFVQNRRRILKMSRITLSEV